MALRPTPPRLSAPPGLAALGALVVGLALGGGCQGPISVPALPSDGGGGSGVGGANQGGTSAAGGTTSSTGGVGSTGGAVGSGGAEGGSGGMAAGPGGAMGSGGAATGGAAMGGAATGGVPSGSGGATSGPGGAKAGTGGAGGLAGGAGSSGAAGAPASTSTMGIVNVGYGGIRIVSRDLGKTWKNEIHWAAKGGDDKNLLRGIAYGNGVWVAGGWRITTSVDGVTWTDHGMAADLITAVACNVTDSIAFGSGRFLCACGDHLVWSTDGLAWKSLTATPKVQGHPALVFDPGTTRFAVTGDNGKSFVSSDAGATWIELAGVASVRLCKGGLTAQTDCPAFFTDGIFLRGEWAGQIMRSTNGTSWSRVYTDPNDNTTFTDYSFAVGPVSAN